MSKNKSVIFCNCFWELSWEHDYVHGAVIVPSTRIKDMDQFKKLDLGDHEETIKLSNLTGSKLDWVSFSFQNNILIIQKSLDRYKDR